MKKYKTAKQKIQANEKRASTQKMKNPSYALTRFVINIAVNVPKCKLYFTYQTF